MPLHDHFRPPLSLRRHWHAFHNSWATYISSELNRQLPPGYFAEANVQFGIEIDVAAMEESGHAASPFPSPTGWTPPAPALSLPFTSVTDIVEVAVFHNEGGPTLAGAVELVSPANKDRPAQRDAFVSKCAAYLQQGVGLVIVDVVTERRANLHEELLTRVGSRNGDPFDAELYATAYRPVRRGDQTSLDVWQVALTLGHVLPTMPLWLRGSICLPLDLEATYERTRQEQRVTANGA